MIFREEALRSRESQRPSRPSTPRASPRWIAGAYWALLALVAVGLTAGALIRVGEVARGPAMVREGAVEAAVPAVFAAGLHPGMPLKLTLRGHRPVTVAVTGAGPEVASAAAAGSHCGPPSAGPARLRERCLWCGRLYRGAWPKERRGPHRFRSARGG